MTPEETIQKFKTKLLELSHLKSALALLSWDQEVNMPPKGAENRAKTIAHLSGLLHETFLSPEFESILNQVKKLRDENNLSEENLAVVREVEREFNLEKKFSAEFVREMAQLTSESQGIWAQARGKNDFQMFLPYLKRMVEMKRKEAEIISYKQSPYDALIDIFEPYTTTVQIEQVLEEVKNFLVPFIQKIKNSEVKIDPKILLGNFPIPKQAEFNKMVVEKLGFDFESGRIDISTHPFAMSLHPQDARITTRYNSKNALESLTGSMHEAGHGMYEQGLLVENFGTPLGEAISLGIHESQSRLWENLVGRSKSFWRYFYPKLQEFFPEPFGKISFDDFYKVFNKAEPTLIRVEADEVTYNLHIIIRFEIEKDLIEGKIQAEDLPRIWNEKVKEYLGLDTPSDALGVLQDVHWSTGFFGYFPTYTLGNLYSAQFFDAAKKQIPDLDQQFERGEFAQFRKWLKDNIHMHGRQYSAAELCKKITGGELTAKHYINYLTKKYGEIYGLEK